MILLALAGVASMFEKALLKCVGKQKQREWEHVDMEEGLKKAGLLNLFPPEVDFGLASYV